MMQTGSNVPAPARAPDAPVAPEAPVAQTPIPRGGGRFIVERQGNRTIFTSAALPPEIMPLAQRVEETAFGLMGLLAAIIILGPLARVWARRIDRRSEIAAVNVNTQQLQHQLLELQQSMDAMSVEVERISESQRFQAKLLTEKRTV